MNSEHSHLTIKAAAKALGVSRPTIYSMIQRGRLKVYRNPVYLRGHGAVLVDRDQINALIAAQREAGWPTQG